MWFAQSQLPMSKPSIFLIAMFAAIVSGQCLAETPALNSTTQSAAEQLVEQMRGFSMQRAAWARSDGTIDPIEQRRQEITDRLRNLGSNCVPALVHALSDPDVQMRRNVELAMISLAGPYESKPQVDIREALPALIKATTDNDTDVRAWAA